MYIHIPFKLTFYGYFKESFSGNTICIRLFRYTHVIIPLYRSLNVVIDGGNSGNEI